MELINKLTAMAAAGSAVESAFMTKTLRELSVGFCKSNGVLYRRSRGYLAHTSGGASKARMTVPTSAIPNRCID